jgi:hypothetical protein
MEYTDCYFTKNKVVTKPQARGNCDVTSFRSDMGTDGATNGWTNQPTNIVSYRGATSRLEISSIATIKPTVSEPH